MLERELIGWDSALQQRCRCNAIAARRDRNVVRRIHDDGTGISERRKPLKRRIDAVAGAYDDLIRQELIRQTHTGLEIEGICVDEIRPAHLALEDELWMERIGVHIEFRQFVV